MAFSSVFNTMKKTGLVKQIDQYLLLQSANEGDTDRKNITNSPSSALGCVRANYYQRSGTPKDPIDARVRRIFDNGHGMHERIQGYLKKMGLLLMDEVPLVNDEYEIQGHTDGILAKKKGNLKAVDVLELKSINGRGFQALKDALEKHKAQAMVYLFCLEEHRKYLQSKYPSYMDFKKSTLPRKIKYRNRYLHLKDGTHYTRDEKIAFKVKQHMLLDELLYHVAVPIDTAILLYECKDTQDMKEFEVKMDESLIGEVLAKYEESNEYWRLGKIPPRECKNKSEGRFCNFVTACFE